GQTITFEAEDTVTHQGVLQIDDEQASQAKALSGFGDATGDYIKWATNLPVEERYKYVWNELNYMVGAQHLINNEIIHDAIFARSGGWQASSVTLNQQTRAFVYGYDGQVLAETFNNDARTYINGGMDKVLWSKDSGGKKQWFNDINGSVYGLANSTGTTLETQRMGAFGETKVYSANGQPRFESSLGNRLGHQGLTDWSEVGIIGNRHRERDAW